MVEEVGALVTVDWLREQLANGRDDLVVLDASIAPHLPQDVGIAGALRFDIDGEFSRADVATPHTMLGPDEFQARVRRLGVSNDTVVVAYDAAGIYSSPRAWWMFRAMGHERVAVLNGGLPGWVAAGQMVAPFGAEPAVAGDFVARPNPRAFVDQQQVLALIDDPAVAVLDARPRERFDATAPEPRPGLRGGHIPGSRSLPLNALVSDARLRDAAEVAEMVKAAQGDATRVVTTCGSGVTACGIALAAHLSGVRDISVYDGSWSEWGRPDGPAITAG